MPATVVPVMKLRQEMTQDFLASYRIVYIPKNSNVDIRMEIIVSAQSIYMAKTLAQKEFNKTVVSPQLWCVFSAYRIFNDGY